jgi:hypothetical protein
VGVAQLVERSDSLAKLFGQGHTETEAERMERLAKATERTAAETAELNKHKRVQAAIEAGNAPSKEQKERTSAAEEAFAEHGPLDKIAAQLATARGGGLNRLSAEEQKELAELERKVGTADAQGRIAAGVSPLSGKELFTDRKVFDQRIDELRRKGAEAALKQAQKDLGEAATDPGRLKDLIGELERRKGDPELIRALKEATPEGKAASQELDKFFADADAKEKENLDKWKASQKKRAEVTKEAAKALEDRYLESLVGEGQAVGAADIRAELEASGMSESAAGKIAEGVLKELHENFLKAVQDRALKEGITPEAAQEALLGDMLEKRNRPGERQAERERKAEEDYDRAWGKFQEKRAKEAVKDIPALDEQLQLRLAAGADPALLTKMLAGKLIGQGIEGDAARGEAGEAVTHARRELNDRMAKGLMEGQARPSQYMSLGSYVDAAQTASNDTNKKMDELIKIAAQQLQATVAAGRAPMVMR